MTKPIQLQAADGRRLCILEPNEAESLVSRGKARRLSKRIYRMNWPPMPPSKSFDTACSLGINDMHALAGLCKMGPREYERLAGYGILADAR
jgi:hypothetical protein